MQKKRPFVFQGIDLDKWRVVDGDSIIVVVDTGDYDTKLRRLRLHKLDVPETTYRAKSELEKTAGRLVTIWVKNWVKTISLKASEIDVISSVKPEKFGHWLGDIVADGKSIVDELINNKFARPYKGELKPIWNEDQLNYIIERLTK